MLKTVIATLVFAFAVAATPAFAQGGKAAPRAACCACCPKDCKCTCCKDKACCKKCDKKHACECCKAGGKGMNCPTCDKKKKA